MSKAKPHGYAEQDALDTAQAMALGHLRGGTDLDLSRQFASAFSTEELVCEAGKCIPTSTWGRILLALPPSHPRSRYATVRRQERGAPRWSTPAGSPWRLAARVA